MQLGVSFVVYRQLIFYPTTYMGCYEAQQIAIVCLSTLQGMREEACLHMFFKKEYQHKNYKSMTPNNAKKREKIRVAMKKQKPTEFLFEVEKEYWQMFYQATD